MVDLVRQLENLLLGQFRVYTDQLSSKFPKIQAQLYSHSIGAINKNDAYDIGIECLLTDASPDQPDNIALTVSLYHLTTEPRINADVVWGHPSGYGEAAFFEDWLKPDHWPAATEETLQKLCDDLPRLYNVLEQSVERGHPGENDA